MTLAIGLSPRTVTRALLAIVALLTVASAVAQVLHYPLDTPYARGLVPLFDSDAEGNLPTWYSSLTLLACCLLAGCIALSARAGEEPYAPHWTALSIVFFLAALDESVRLHELVNRWLSPDLEGGGLLSAVWVVPGVLFALALALAYRPVVAQLPPRVRLLATRGALVFAIGALGLELIEGAVSDIVGKPDSLADGLVSVGQECLEMLGVILLIEAMMTYLAARGPSLSIRFAGHH